jgi:prepilin-type N-terminal cleavage/methylation domain-containing protein
MNDLAHRPARGFTLLELLVVITVIGLLIALGSSAIRNVGGMDVTSGVARSEAFLHEARAVAVGSGDPSRLLIDIDDPGSENYLRRLVIIARERGGDGVDGEERWRLVGAALFLPRGVYFSRQFSRKNHSAGSGEIEEMTLTGQGQTFDGRYLYYEFNGEGICVTGRDGDGGYSGVSFVLGGGMRDLGGQPRTTGKGRRNFGGFVIWRNGSTSLFRDPQQVIGSESPQEF